MLVYVVELSVDVKHYVTCDATSLLLLYIVCMQYDMTVMGSMIIDF